jgi:hypothetical protein
VDKQAFGKWGPEQSTRLTYTRHIQTSPELGNREAFLELGILNNVGGYLIDETSVHLQLQQSELREIIASHLSDFELYTKIDFFINFTG